MNDVVLVVIEGQALSVAYPVCRFFEALVHVDPAGLDECADGAVQEVFSIPGIGPVLHQ